MIKCNIINISDYEFNSLPL